MHISLESVCFALLTLVEQSPPFYKDETPQAANPPGNERLMLHGFGLYMHVNMILFLLEKKMGSPFWVRGMSLLHLSLTRDISIAAF